MLYWGTCNEVETAAMDGTERKLLTHSWQCQYRGMAVDSEGMYYLALTRI